MHKKSFAFGMGIGILSLTLIFYFLYGYQKSVLLGMDSGTSVSMSDQDIITEAKKLGMTFFLTDEKALPAQTVMSDDEIMMKALELGMSYTGVEQINEEKQGESDETENAGDGELSPADIIQSWNNGQKIDEDFQTVNQNNQKNEDNTSSDGEASVVYIPRGAISSEISKLLAENGVVPSEDEFNAFLIEKRSTKILGFGERKFPNGSSFEEILMILTQ